jgi:hypothetical protein
LRSIRYGEGDQDSDRRIPGIRKAQQRLGRRPKYDLDETIEGSTAGFAPCAAGPVP